MLETRSTRYVYFDLFRHCCQYDVVIEHVACIFWTDKKSFLFVFFACLTCSFNRNQAEKSVDRKDRSLHANCKHYLSSVVQRPSWACSRPLTSWCSRSLTRRVCGRSRPHPMCVFNQQKLLRSMEDAPVKRKGRKARKTIKTTLYGREQKRRQYTPQN